MTERRRWFEWIWEGNQESSWPCHRWGSSSAVGWGLSRQLDLCLGMYIWPPPGDGWYLHSWLERRWPRISVQVKGWELKDMSTCRDREEMKWPKDETERAATQKVWMTRSVVSQKPRKEREVMQIIKTTPCIGEFLEESNTALSGHVSNALYSTQPPSFLLSCFLYSLFPSFLLPSFLTSLPLLLLSFLYFNIIPP